jgi:glycosyltransferase involved in cell wall biosynthesis
VFGGYELGCLSIAEACRRAGHDVTVVTSYPLGNLYSGPFEHSLRVLRVFLPAYDLTNESRTFQQSADRTGLAGIVPANCLALANVIGECKPDAIWCFNPLGIGPIGIFEVAAMSGVPTVVHLMDHLDEMVRISQNGFHVTGRWAEAKRRLAAIGCSQATLAGNTRVGEYRMTEVIPNGIPLGTAASRQPEFRRIEPHEPLRLVYFGQIIPEKGVSGLVPAVRRLTRLLKRPVELHLVGRCPAYYESALRESIRSEGLDAAVVWHGHLDRDGVDRVLSGMHIATLPLRVDEPFGYVGLEAVVRRLPVVAGSQAGFVDMLPAGYPYLLSHPHAVDEIVTAVRDICGDQDACERWTGSAREQVLAQGDLDRVIVPRYLSFIAAVRGSAPPEDGGHGGVGSLLASWQMNRNLTRLMAAPPAGDSRAGAAGRPPAWRRCGRAARRLVRDAVPEPLRLQLRTIASRLRRPPHKR